MARKTIVAGNTMIIHVSPHKSRNSIVASPNGSTYTVEYTNSPPKVTPTWVAVTGMTAATTLQTAELGSITAFRVAATGGTNVIFDYTAAK